MNKRLVIWLADDDEDDCLLFKEALNILDINPRLVEVRNGDQLMMSLDSTASLPDIIFLDLNMPRKNGFTCLSEIKKSEKFKTIPVVILSTSLRQNVVDQLYEKEARYYIRKPNDLKILQNLLCIAINNSVNLNQYQITKDLFVLS